MMKSKLTKLNGQGVIEYAGALIVATLLIASVISAGSLSLGGMFSQVLTSVSTFFQNVTFPSA